jgi:hypothetical protein
MDSLIGQYCSNRLLADERDPKRKAAIAHVIQKGHEHWRFAESVARSVDRMQRTYATEWDVAVGTCYKQPIDFDALDRYREEAQELVAEFGGDTCFEMNANPHSLISVVEQLEGAAALCEPLRQKFGGKRK